jgi:hypothetical protein
MENKKIKNIIRIFKNNIIFSFKLSENKETGKKIFMGYNFYNHAKLMESVINDTDNAY